MNSSAIAVELSGGNARRDVAATSAKVLPTSKELSLTNAISSSLKMITALPMIYPAMP
jgi:hypothetical protein